MTVRPSPLPTRISLTRRAREGYVFVHFIHEDHFPEDFVVLTTPVPIVDGAVRDERNERSGEGPEQDVSPNTVMYNAVVEVPVNAETVSIGIGAFPVLGQVFEPTYVAELDPAFLEEFR